MSATTQVKVFSLENILIALGQGFHILETKIRILAKGESVTDVPGSKSVAGKRTVYLGTWESRSMPKRSSQRAKKAERGYDVSEVGLTRSRGVDRVMPAEFRRRGTLEGVSSVMQRDEVCYATP